MFWLQRPPYLRWAGAGVILLAAIVWDLRPDPTETRPFTAAPAAAGTPVSIEWRRVPAGVLPDTDVAGMVAAVDLPSGSPLVPAMLAPPVDLPPGWPAIPLDIGAAPEPGDRLLLIVVDPPLTADAVVVAAQQGDAYGFDYSPALVAVPAEAAVPVATASRAGTLIVALAPAAG